MTRIERIVADGQPADVEWHGDDGWIRYGCREGEPLRWAGMYPAPPPRNAVLPPEVVAAVGFRRAQSLMRRPEGAA